MAVVTYRMEVSLKVFGESILPELDPVRELCLGDLECLGSNVDVLGAEVVRQVDKG